MFVTVGTDHHPFDRLVGWVDEWLAQAAPRPGCLVQSGTSAPPRSADWRAYLRHDEMRRALDGASVVVCHGGPATIMDCRQAGLLPVVVPRRAELGEHVDGHQVAFTARLAALGQVVEAGSREELWTLLDRALADPDALRLQGLASEAAATAARFGALVDALVTGTGRRALGDVAATERGSR